MTTRSSVGALAWWLAAALSSAACGGMVRMDRNADGAAPEPLPFTEPFTDAGGPWDGRADIFRDAGIRSPDSAPDTTRPDDPSHDTVVPPTVVDLGQCAWDVHLTSDAFNVNLAALLRGASCVARVTVRVPANVTIGSRSSRVPALVTGALPPGSLVVLVLDGTIMGAGGAGGSGGNGGSGGRPRSCGRDGEAGGAAVRLEVDAMMSGGGQVMAGGGGGAGASGFNLSLGGGGGAGSMGGPGGAPASELDESGELDLCGQDNGIRSGQRGVDGSRSAGGAHQTGGWGFLCRSGRGGAHGEAGTSSDCAGSAQGGAPGHAFEVRQGVAWTVASTVRTHGGTVTVP